MSSSLAIFRELVTGKMPLVCKAYISQQLIKLRVEKAFGKLIKGGFFFFFPCCLVSCDT